MAPHRSVHAFTARFFPHSSVSLRWAVAAFALLAALCWASPAWAADSAVFASGAGTEADPYLIANASQLAAFRDAVNAGDDYDGKYVALGADIDLESAERTPIGVGTRKSSGIAEGSTPFAGTFDGAGHVISGLKIASTQGADFAIGLFGILDGATVKNLTVADAEVTVPQSELAGILCGMMANDATASGVSVSGSVAGKAGVGGIAGRMTLSGTIENCENSASVAAADGVGNAGGIVGAAYYTTPTGRMAITGCRNSGSISGTDCIGGIAGLSAAFVSNCENSGAINGTSYSVGGIVGEQKNYGAVSGCTNSGAVSTSNAGAYGIGGIVGWARYDGARARLRRQRAHHGNRLRQQRLRARRQLRRRHRRHVLQRGHCKRECQYGRVHRQLELRRGHRGQPAERRHLVAALHRARGHPRGEQREHHPAQCHHGSPEGSLRLQQHAERFHRARQRERLGGPGRSDALCHAGRRLRNGP